MASRNGGPSSGAPPLPRLDSVDGELGIAPGGRFLGHNDSIHGEKVSGCVWEGENGGRMGRARPEKPRGGWHVKKRSTRPRHTPTHTSQAARRRAVTELMFFASVGDLKRVERIVKLWKLNVSRVG